VKEKSGLGEGTLRVLHNVFYICFHIGYDIQLIHEGVDNLKYIYDISFKNNH